MHDSGYLQSFIRNRNLHHTIDLIKFIITKCVASSVYSDNFDSLQTANNLTFSISNIIYVLNRLKQTKYIILKIVISLC